ncbi:AAA family ATPase [Mucilaginibacter daejeonensis]|uniref:AAA family ATPase n=1 Tax=Mucilaginibacter daejeonensis TaxID=398049 RepID=UPI001D1759AA|nr:AAA family ATPase [Mucilaginibacter daejeonensis]UEG55033.1 AAA family ATPase [Mucilaginibacter daejeonensis]
MIRIHRPPAPPFFQSVHYLQMRDDLENRARDGSQERLKFDTNYYKEIKSALIEAFNNKCAYCESQLGVAAEMQIDNFRPKQMKFSESFGNGPHYYWLAYEWENLYAVCPNCNSRKANKFPLEDEATRCRIGAQGNELQLERYLLLDPVVDDPGAHLNFELDGLVRGASSRGDATIEILGLNRRALVDARKKEAEQLILLLTGPNNNPHHREGLVDEIKHGRSVLPYLALLQQVIYRWERDKAGMFQQLNVTVPPPPTEEARQVLDFSQFSIRRIELVNFKAIGELALDIPTQETDGTQASWLLMLGDNGVGKSTILQAVALTLAGESQLKKLKIEPIDLLRTGEESGYVHVYSYELDQPLSLKFTATEFVSVIPEPVSFLLGYGATRNLPNRNSKTGKQLRSPVNVANLFDQNVPLTDPEQWLGTLNGKTLKRVLTALFDVLDLGKHDAVNFQGELTVTRSGHTARLSQMSDGYRTMLALACDIMRTLSRENQGYHLTQGVVLIDELGNHLHPRWRMKVVSALRTAFPLLQFIVSTHEPLCLRGLRHGEVVVLMRDRENQVKKLDKSLLPDHNLMRVDQLLTSDLFGLLNTLDETTERKYEDYYRLLQQDQRSPEDQEKITDLTGELAQEEIPGATPQMQALYQVVNETFAKKLKEDGFKIKTVLKAETIAEIKELIGNKKLDWL